MFEEEVWVSELKMESGLAKEKVHILLAQEQWFPFLSDPMPHLVANNFNVPHNIQTKFVDDNISLCTYQEAISIAP